MESVRTIEPGQEESRRFYLYIMPIMVFNVGIRLYWWTCRYLAGFFEANLVEDELIIIWMHFWGTSKNHFVYEYNERSLVTKYIGVWTFIVSESALCFRA